MISYELDKNSVNEIRKALDQLAKKMRNKILRKGLRRWGTLVADSIKSNITWDGESFRRSVVIKTKSLKRGKVIWMGVGLRKDGKYKGRLSHLFEYGFRPRGKGQKIYQTQYVSKAYQSNVHRLLPIIKDTITEAVRESTKS